MARVRNHTLWRPGRAEERVWRGHFCVSHYVRPQAAEDASILSGPAAWEGGALKRMIRSHHLWLFIGYVGILALMARAHG